ncbi:MAG: hypothetical protein ACE37J_06530 [Pikeienuella sp.]|uniref:hypothetical protein n=1 Tax=Pikeienuella sp. TaxID=2831957 RepID=UPI00391ACA38
MSASMCRVVSYTLAIIVAAVAARMIVGEFAVATIVLFVLFAIGLWTWLPKLICRQPAHAAGAAAAPFAPKPSIPTSTLPRPAPPAPRAPAPKEPEPVAPVAAEPTAPVAGGHWSSGVRADSGMAAKTGGQTAIRPSAPLAEEATLRDGVGSWKYEAPKPAPEGADDLKKIKGVGPVLEGKLHALGVLTYAQIAGWSAEDVARVDEQLNFKGRIEREGWIEQAKALSGA